VGYFLHSHFFKVLHEKDGNDWGRWQTHSHTVGLLMKMTTEVAKGKGSNTVEECQATIFTLTAQDMLDLPSGHLAEE
jgi:hypothetical protein